MDIEEKLRANAELVMRELGQHSPEPLGYNPESVRWLDGFIERQRVRDDATPELIEGLINILGSYLGQCIIQYYGGAWQIPQEGYPAVEFSLGNTVYPFSKVRKQFENGAENGDSIAGLFNTIGVVFARHFKPGSGAPDTTMPPSQLRPAQGDDVDRG